ncbi:hypothetical protein ABLB37_22800 [Vibrio parahaemolyticus]|uniref:Uncharacterized protein n=3 Tax=Vibrio parahaemolyticus TaxID=670 RepID=A0A0L8UXY9_VIBPH|nr:hypothetical protein [Vibrio parahaemolyticus]EFO36333.1 conserved hypothetical protein [Vibrio parahaemolyticus Peru-466]EFO49280.1 conserved hypothetical protein [Vibrio parahaemolyticus K5030]EVU10567.1 hypothetical protein D046_8115 [Vibrio parahaemolyticus V-223/04]ARC19794.1 hypothetical protein A6J30_15545 [Vibrio parahaemolyticus]AZV70670.1 hypothetical protein D0853_06795 [Vibrio parahaemolyticus]
MPRVEFGMKTESGEEFTINGELTDDELLTITNFVQSAEKLLECRLVQCGNFLPKKITWNQVSGFDICEVNEIDFEALFACLHLSRPFILQKEPWSYNSVSGILGRVFSHHSEVKRELKGLRKIYSDGALSYYFDISIQEKSIFDESRFLSWLNSYQYHRDQDKSVLYDELKSSFSENGAHHIMLIRLHGKLQAIEQLTHLCKVIIKSSAKQS